MLRPQQTAVVRIALVFAQKQIVVLTTNAPAKGIAAVKAAANARKDAMQNATAKVNNSCI